MKKYLKISFWILIVLLICVVISNKVVQSATEGKTTFDVQDINSNKVGLVLGTSKYLSNGNLNLYFVYRIKAVVELYNSGKIEFVLISGDNGNKNYDEPTDFRDELVAKGIPEEKIYLDYAGFRTLDSVVRAKEIFGQTELTIISQKFHNERAIYIAEKYGIKAVGYNAQDVTVKYGLKTKLREYLARTKVFIDILFNVKPKFLGEKIEIK